MPHPDDLNMSDDLYDDDTMIPIETSPEFVDKAEFLTQRYRKLVAETCIKEEQATIERLRKEKLLGELIATDECIELFQGLGTFIRARLKRLVAEAPPRLEGLDANGMIGVLRELIDGVCADLSEVDGPGGSQL